MEAMTDILARIQQRIDAACSRASRRPDDVTIIGVTKTFGPEVVREAWDAGIGIFGENKVQEAAWKIPESASGPAWHLIGHLQRNKIRPALELFSVIHSVDSVRLLDAIEACADEQGARPEILLEVNVSGEASKFGLRPDAVPEVIERALACRSVTLTGLMTMVPFTPKAEEARPHFTRLRELRDRWEHEFGIGLPHLSMGMSHDFEIAVEEGATWVRLGTALFGDRPKIQRPALTENIDD